jgi:tRNA(Arg) A34 adenosine deaminase TadA
MISIKVSWKAVPDSIIEYADNLASFSSMKHKMSAVIFRNGEILGSDYNRWMGSTNEPSACLYGVPVFSRHGEIGAIRKVYRHYGTAGFVGASIYIHRYNKKSRNMLAKPCKHCMQVIEMMGIKKVYWSGMS